MNLVLNDTSGLESDFIEALEAETGQSWEHVDWVANQPRTGIVSELKRYARYFINPLRIVFCEDVERIAAWQQFYGINYAFWSRLFHRPKTAQLTVMTFIYKLKGGFVGKLYDRYVRYAVTSQYVDRIVCTTSVDCARYAAYFGLPEARFVFIPWGIPDRASGYASVGFEPGLVLAAGRSNRDHRYLINELADTSYRLIVVDDTLRLEDIPQNVAVLNNVHGADLNEYIARCWALVIPFADSETASGQTVLLQAWQFGKPVVATKCAGLTEDYLKDGETGIVVEKTRGGSAMPSIACAPIPSFTTCLPRTAGKPFQRAIRRRVSVTPSGAPLQGRS